MNIHECQSCGASYGPGVREEWGRTKRSSGYGSRPICTQLVPSGIFGVNALGERIEGLQVCGGALAVARLKDGESRQLVDDRLIELT